MLYRAVGADNFLVGELALVQAAKSDIARVSPTNVEHSLLNPFELNGGSLPDLLPTRAAGKGPHRSWKGSLQSIGRAPSPG